MNVKIKGIIEYDVVNYKKPCLTIMFPRCTFKCDKEYGCAVCQNSTIISLPDIECTVKEIVEIYLHNPLVKAVCCQGLEPFDSFNELYSLIKELRKQTDDDVVIYTGYTEEEIQDFIQRLSKFKNIVVKFGRFIPNDKKVYDDLLGVTLASSNQYAKYIRES